MLRPSLIFVAGLLSLSSLAAAFADGPETTSSVSAKASEPADPTRPPEPSERKRILVVFEPQSERSRTEMAKLNAPGGTLEILKKRGWKVGEDAASHIRLVDRTKPIDPELQPILAQLPVGDGPVVVAIEGTEIARSFKRGCTTPLDPWTFGWLMTGNDDRPVDFIPEPIKVATTGNYRLRGNHWSIEGDWNPTQASVARHLRTSHSNGIPAGAKIEVWSIEELRSLHDDIHDREEGFRGRYAAATTPTRSAGGAGIGKPGSKR